jgi:hypothetical protein
MEHYHSLEALPGSLSRAMSWQVEPAWGALRHFGGEQDEEGRSTGVAVFSRALVFVTADKLWGYPLDGLRALSLRANTVSCTVGPSNDAYEWTDRGQPGPVHHPPRAVDVPLLQALAAQLVASGQSWDRLLGASLARFLETTPSPARALGAGWRARTAGSRRAELQVVLDALHPVGLLVGRGLAEAPLDPWSLLPALYACSAEALARDTLTLLAQAGTSGGGLLDLAEEALHASGQHRLVATVLRPLLEAPWPLELRELAAVLATRGSSSGTLDAVLLLNQRRRELDVAWRPVLELLVLLLPILGNERGLLGSEMPAVDPDQIQEMLASLPGGPLPEEQADLMRIGILDAALRRGRGEPEALLARMESRSQAELGPAGLLCLLAASTTLVSSRGRDRRVQTLVGRLVGQAEERIPEHPYLEAYRALVGALLPSLGLQQTVASSPVAGAVGPVQILLVQAVDALRSEAGCVPMFPHHLTLFHRDLPELQQALERAATRQDAPSSASPERRSRARVLPWAAGGGLLLLPLAWMASQLAGPCGGDFDTLLAGCSRGESYECLGTGGDVLLTIHSLLYALILLGGWAWASDRGARAGTGLAIGSVAVLSYCGLLWLLGQAIQALFG